MEYIIVQAGGKGTRLGYLTQNKPKALVPVENLPMLFHLFRKYPDKKFVIIADYHKEVLREYLAAFADVKYQVVDADGTGTCAGVQQAMALIPNGQAFMLIWSDLILPAQFQLPEEYQDGNAPMQDYIGISQTFPCRWSYRNGQLCEEASTEYGVAGFFLFTDKSKIADVPRSGELVRWMQSKGMQYQVAGLAGTKEFGLLEEYQKMGQEKCRPFNRIVIEGDVLTKEAVDAQGAKLAKRECAWYEKAQGNEITILPQIYGQNPLKMEYIKGKNIYEYDLEYEDKKKILETLVSALRKLHGSETVPADSFSVKEAYYTKTMDRLAQIQDLVPFAREKEIIINGKRCRNVYYYKRELEKKLESLQCDTFAFIHGDCTFSNMMLREDGSPVLIDPRGYFGFTELYGDVRYDWAKVYYSVVGNYDRFNLKDFRLKITDRDVQLEITSNHWEDMEQEFFALTGADPEEIKLLHAVIWLSLTTYAWQDYDSVCGAFYNGLYYLEDVL
ncbi:MAG: NTP transferase domain-containing protein [Lachnospiraceae bacterium]|nr:NTP transferase domain-containing protein [Lachnospiraceae bacterium]